MIIPCSSQPSRIFHLRLVAMAAARSSSCARRCLPLAGEPPTEAGLLCPPLARCCPRGQEEPPRQGAGWRRRRLEGATAEGSPPASGPAGMEGSPPASDAAASNLVRRSPPSGSRRTGERAMERWKGRLIHRTPDLYHYRKIYYD